MTRAEVFEDVSVEEKPPELLSIMRRIVRSRMELNAALNDLVNYEMAANGNSMKLELEVAGKLAADDEKLETQEPVKGLVVNHYNATAEWQGETVKMTRGEFLVMVALAKAPDRIRSRDELMGILPETDDGGILDRSVDSYIKRIRRKFRKVDPEFPYIRTMYGMGYVFRR